LRKSEDAACPNAPSGIVQGEKTYITHSLNAVMMEFCQSKWFIQFHWSAEVTPPPPPPQKKKKKNFFFFLTKNKKEFDKKKKEIKKNKKREKKKKTN